MASGPVIAIEPLLTPIEGGNPSGRSLVYESEYDTLREARRQEDSTNQGDWAREVKTADWETVIELGSTCLATRTKDLQIAAWMTEALVRTHGFAGLRDGFRLIQQLLESFWETLYPEFDDGDLEYRQAPFVFLNGEKILPMILRETPLTVGFRDQNYPYMSWLESRTVDNIGKRDPEQLEALIAEGKITGEQFDEAVAQTPRSFYETLNVDFEAAWNAYKALDAALDARFGKEAPSLANIRKALEDVRKVLTPILNARRAAEPYGDSAQAVEDDGGDEPTDDGSTGWDDSPVESDGDAEEAPVIVRRKPRPRSSGGPINSGEDARERILEAAAYLRRNEPEDPVPFAVVRAMRLAELYRLGSPPDPAELAGPASETRQALKRLAAAEDWDALLEEAEHAIGRPEGRAWLDAHRYALAALAAGSATDRSAAVGVSKALLRAMLADFPDLPRAELADDTPTANAETREWLDAEILPPPIEPPAEPHQPLPVFVAEPGAGAADPGSATEPDVWELAMENVQAGNPNEALRRLRQAMVTAASGRERFRRKLQMAELCLHIGNHRIARPLLEELARQVDDFHLEQWEDESLSARVWGALYRTLRDSEGDEGRLQEVYTRLCRLDINQALSYDTH